MLSLLMQSACPIELIGTELFGSDAEAAEDQLTGIRAWHDALWQTDAGWARLELYRQLHPTLLERIAGDEGFRSRAASSWRWQSPWPMIPTACSAMITSGAGWRSSTTWPLHRRSTCIQLQTARALFQTMSGFSAQAALAVVAERSPS